MTQSPDTLLRAALSDFLGREADHLAPEENLFEAGLDSIGLLRLVNRLRRDRIEADFASLSQEPTLAAWTRLLEAAAEAEELSLAPAPVDVPTPLGVMQHAYWVGRSPGQRLGGVAAHLYVEFDHDGEPALEPDRLRNAFARLMQRHATLRSRVTVDGHQEVLSDLPVPFVVYDLRPLSEAERQARLDVLRQTYSHQALDVESGAVFTAALSLLPGGATRLHLDMDMIAADAVSYRLLMADLVALYQQPDRDLPGLGLSYRDYLIGVAAQTAAKAKEAGAVWAARMDRLPGAPVLPERLLSPEAAAAPRVARQHMWLAPARKAALGHAARVHGTTPAMTVAAVLAEVVGRWSATDHFLLNVPMFDRPALHPEIERIAGDFSSSVMLEVDLRLEQSFAERVRAMQAQMHEDAAHAAYSGLDVLRELGRVRGETVLAPVVFTSALGLGELFAPEVSACVGRPVWVISQGPQVVLDAQVTEFEGGLLVNWDIREEVLATGVADAMFAQFEQWLTAVIDQPDRWQAPLRPLAVAAPARVLDGKAVRILDRYGNDCPAHVAGRLSGPKGAAGSQWARADESGAVEILGNDGDCRVWHGVTVWPQDVASALRTDSRVAEVAVLAEAAGFAAAVVLAPGVTDITGKTLRAELARRAPAHLLPHRIVVMEMLPRSESGEIDRAALALGIAAQGGSSDLLAPRDDLEQLMAEVWAEALGLASIGVNEEFIALGGDSLLATRVVARLQEDLDSDAITLRALFRYPTVAELAEVLRTGEDGARIIEIAALTMEIRNMTDEEVAALLTAEEAEGAASEPVA